MDDRFLAIHSRGRIDTLGAELRETGSVSSCVIDGVEIQFWRVGTGERCVVFLHGNSTAKEVFFKQFSGLERSGRQLIAIDLPGHGCSDDAVDPAKQYTIPGYASIVHDLLEQLNVCNYVLVGWSLGGNIALEMAGRSCDIGALLIMGAPPVGPGPDNFESAYLPDPVAPVAAQRNPSDDELAAFVKAIYGRCDPLPDLFFEAAKRTDGQARETMVSHWLGGNDGFDQLSTVEHWDKPICVVHGREESLVSLTYIRNARWKNLWKGEVQLLEDCGHAPFLENPEGFNKLLESFVADVF